MEIFEWRDRASGLRPLAWRPGRRNWQAGSLLRRNGVAGYGNCLHVISVRAGLQAPARTARGALGIAQARTRVLAASRFHHSARRLAVICVLTSAALTNRSQPKATRCAFSFFMTKTVSEIISLVPGSCG